MNAFYSHIFMITFFVCNLFINMASGQEIFKVVDQNNQPLNNVVIELLSSVHTKKTPEYNETYVMDQIGKTFEPRLLVVPKNSLVSFPNSDDIRHHVYSFSPAKSFQLKLYAGKPKSPLRFDDSGIVVLGCNIHDSMVGYIYITNGNPTYVSNKEGEIIVAENFNNITQIYVWHEQAIKGSEHRVEYKKQALNIIDGVISLVVPVEDLEPRNSFENLVIYAE